LLRTGRSGRAPTRSASRRCGLPAGRCADAAARAGQRHAAPRPPSPLEAARSGGPRAALERLPRGGGPRRPAPHNPAGPPHRRGADPPPARLHAQGTTGSAATTTRLQAETDNNIRQVQNDVKAKKGQVRSWEAGPLAASAPRRRGRGSWPAAAPVAAARAALRCLPPARVSARIRRLSSCGHSSCPAGRRHADELRRDCEVCVRGVPGRRERPRLMRAQSPGLRVPLAPGCWGGVARRCSLCRAPGRRPLRAGGCLGCEP
jgi:hypothetical protein